MLNAAIDLQGWIYSDRLPATSVFAHNIIEVLSFVDPGRNDYFSNSIINIIWAVVT